MYWLPFAVSKEHWSKARLVAEEILGLIASGNTRSFAPDMVYTVISRFNYPLPLLIRFQPVEGVVGQIGETGHVQ